LSVQKIHRMIGQKLVNTYKLMLSTDTHRTQKELLARKN